MTLAQDLARRASGQPEPKGATVADLIKRQMPAIQRALPTNTNPERFAQIVLTETKRNPKLLFCDPMTLLGSMMTAAQLGLQPGPLGHCFLIPRKGQVQFQLGYKGMIDLALRGPGVLSVDAHVVYENDDFSYRYGSDAYLDHTPNLEDPGARRCVYAVANLGKGCVFRVLGFPEVERRRARSSSPDSPAWRDDYDAMSAKTAVRALAPFMPQTPEFAEALRLDDSVQTEITPLEDAADPVRVENEAQTVEVVETAPDAAPDSEADEAAKQEALALTFEIMESELPAYREFLRAKGFSFTPSKWTAAQARDVVAYLESPAGDGG